MWACCFCPGAVNSRLQTSRTLEEVIASLCETRPAVTFSVQLLYPRLVNNLHAQNGSWTKTLKRVSLRPINHLLLPYVFPEPVLVNTREAKMAPKIVHLIKYLFACYIFILDLVFLILNTKTFKFKWKLSACIFSDVLHRNHFGGDRFEVNTKLYIFVNFLSPGSF